MGIIDIFAALLSIAITLFLLTLILRGYRRRNTLKKTTHPDFHQPRLLLYFLILLVLCMVVATIYYSEKFLPFPEAWPGSDTVPVFTTTTLLTLIAFLITQALLFYFAFRYRKKPRATAKYITGSLKLELSWIAIASLSFLFLFIWGQILWARIINPPKGDALEIEIMAEQFVWRARYPGDDQQLGRSAFQFIDRGNAMGIDINDPYGQDDFIPVQLHVQKDRPVKITLRSKDVIHSLYIPFLRTKMDAVPGMTTRTHFTPATTTKSMREKLNDPDFNYEIACAELCGRMHFAMKLILVVDDAVEFNNWYSKQKSWTSKHPAYNRHNDSI